jgi:hypothetical protein
MSIEDVCNESPEVGDTSGINEESAPVWKTNDFGPVFLGVPLWLAFYKCFFSIKVTVYLSGSDNRHLWFFTTEILWNNC